MDDVRIQGVTKSFGETVAIDDLDLTIKDGEFVVLLGPTGAGKTTTLRLIAGLERPDSGTIHIGGHDATALSPDECDTAFVFQQYSLYPHLSVFDKLAFPLRSPARRFPEDAVRRRVEEVARMVRIDIGHDHAARLRFAQADLVGLRDQPAPVTAVVHRAAHDHAAAERQLRVVHDGAVGVDGMLDETEGVAEPVDHARRVAVAQGRDDGRAGSRHGGASTVLALRPTLSRRRDAVL